MLADESVYPPIVDALRSAGHDVTWIAEAAPGTDDPPIALRARAEDRILLTFDHDFGDLIFRDRLPPPPGVILLRLPERWAWTRMAERVTGVLNSRTDWSGTFAVLDQRRVRFRPLPEDPR